MFGTLGPGPGPAPLVGRQDALKVLSAAVCAATAGAAQCLVVTGEAGIGKSRLLAETARGAAAQGMAVAEGRATELDRLSPLVTLVTALGNGTPPVLDEPDRVELAARSAVPYRQTSLLTERIAAYTRSRPLLIVLDDVQWADEATALLVRSLVPALRDARVVWLLAGRPLPEASAMRVAVEGLVESGARSLALGPLSDEAVEELTAHTLGARPGGGVRALAAGAAGNPFLLQELLRALREQGRVLVEDGVARVTPGALPEDFRAQVARRWRHLSPAARQLTEAGAVLARPFAIHEAAGVTGVPVREMTAATEEAIAQGHLVAEGPLLRFRHDLIREAVYDNLATPVKHALHREAGSVLAAEGRPAAESATHVAWGARRGDAQVLRVLRDAADSIVGVAPGVAADLLMRLVELGDPGDPDRPDNVCRALSALSFSGRMDEAMEMAEVELAAASNPTALATVRHGVAAALKFAGRTPEVLTLVDLALADRGVPVLNQAQLWSLRAHTLVDGGLSAGEDPGCEAADAAGAEAVRLGGAAEEPAAVTSGLTARSRAALAAGRVEEAVVLAERATGIAEQSGGEARWHAPRRWLGEALAVSERFAEAEAAFDLGQREAERLGVPWAVPRLRGHRARLWLAAGRITEATAEAEATLNSAVSLGTPPTAQASRTLLARLAILRDDLSSARSLLAAAHRLADSGVRVADDELLLADVLLREAQARSDRDAADRGDGLWAILPEWIRPLCYEPGLGPELVRIALRAGLPEQAERAAAASRLLAVRSPRLASAQAAALHVDALLSGSPEELRRTVGLWRSAPRPLALARALEDAAKVTADRDEALALWEEAFTVYGTAGAVRGAARARQELRALGVRRRMPRSADRQAEGWGSITPSEMRVVRLVTDGLTNRQVANRLFLSRHTVDAHLRNVFAKLGVSSRVELARLMAVHLAEGDTPGPDVAEGAAVRGS
ncbi:DNA-binding CsgD family transcriptional regulator [Streptomyces sp. SFB5A]|uniref:DNA-binding CsgD family transcriptional regulator n=1 Tax=Streptomyces nymphaeiformis TaxID=2663842 RepID=A0A7W7TX47_9ACTN|nr:DNA-binding CsgD family transcriptional regulator [Streptomyces nymphaeiformis]